MNGNCLRVRHKPDGNVIVVGAYREGTATFGMGGKPQPPPVTASMFLVELTPAGANVRTTRFTSGGGGAGDICALAVGPTGGIAVAGKLDIATDLGSGTPGGQGAIMASFDSKQAWLWDRAPFNSLSPSFGDFLFANALAITSSGTTLVGGGFNGKVDLGGGPLPITYGAFLASYDVAGTYQSATSYVNAGIVALALTSAQTPVFATGYAINTDLGSGPLNGTGWAVVKLP